MLGKKKWFLFIYLILSIQSFAFLKIDVEPRSIDMSNGKQITKEISVYNLTNEFVRYKIYFEKPKELKVEYYIGNKLMIYPRVISLEPKGSQVIRLRLKTPVDTKENDYLAKLCFEELTPQKEGHDKIPTSRDDISLGITFSVKIKMSVLATSESTSPMIDINNTKIEEIKIKENNMKFLVLKTKNNGKRLFKPRARIVMLKGENKLNTESQFFNMMVQEEEENLKINITNFSIGDQFRVEIFDDREPKNIIFQKNIKI